MKVEIWSDVVCPWCFVGKRHLEAALADFAHAGDVEIEWKAYELDPHAPAIRPGSYAERISSKYGIPVGEARARIARIVDVGAAAGIDFRFDHARPGNTFDAHRLLHHAAATGRQDELKERLFAATFTEGHPIGDREVLVELAGDVGIAQDDARRVLESGEHADDVRLDERTAMELGVQGVPFFVFDRRFAVSGAQPPQVLLDVLQRAWSERQPVELVVSESDDACDDGSCEL